MENLNKYLPEKKTSDHVNILYEKHICYSENYVSTNIIHVNLYIILVELKFKKWKMDTE